MHFSFTSRIWNSISNFTCDGVLIFRHVQVINNYLSFCFQNQMRDPLSVNVKYTLREGYNGNLNSIQNILFGTSKNETIQ